MPTLNELVAPNKQQLISQLGAYVLEVVDKQGGITGMAIKGALGTAKKVNPQVVTKAIAALLPDALDALDPYWQNKGSESFGAHLEANKEAAAEAVLGCADKLAAQVNQQALAKAYKSLRGKASKIVADNIAGAGDVIEAAV